MAQIRVSCPKCQRLYPVSAADLERPLVCKPCNQEFRPQKIDDYVLLDRLGEGMFGVVYRAWDVRLKREVAIKQLNERTVPEEDVDNWVKRAVTEAEALAKIEFHPNVLPLYNSGYHGQKFYVVTPVIRGKSLDKLIPDSGYENPLEAVELGITILRALNHVHRFKVFHRDMKPSNIMQDENKNLYILDFGLAAMQQLDYSKWSEKGTVLGTPAYMPPEQAIGDVHRVGPWSDQYGAGCILYKLLTGHVPYPGKGYIVLATVADPKKPPIPLRQYRRDIDPELERIVLKSISKFPGDRYGSCEEMAKVLQNWAERWKRRSVPEALPVKQTERDRERSSKRRGGKGVLFWVLLVVVFAGFAVGGYFLWKESAKKSSTQPGKFHDFTK